MEYTHDIDELIAKQLSGEIAPEEKVLLEKWRSESSDNSLYFNQMQQIWARTELGKQNLPGPLDVEDALARTKVKLQAAGAPAKAKVLWLNVWRVGIAASIVLMLGAIWLFQRDSGQPTVLLATTENTLRDTLSDGSMVSINQHSSVSASFSRKARRVKMSGEAYFEVAPNPEKPFIVEVQQVEVTVVGTKFNVDDQSDPGRVIVSVEEGKVQVRMGRQTELLLAGEQASIDGQSGQITKKQQKPSSNVSAWANRRFVFDETPLSEVIPLLEKTYQVKINLANKDLARCRLHVRFNNEPIERILLVIAETFSLELKTSNGQYTLDGPGCE